MSQLGISSIVAQAFQMIDDKPDHIERNSSSRIRDSSGQNSTSDDDAASSALTDDTLIPFVFRNVQQGARFMCVVRRSRSGMRMSYRLFLQDHNAGDSTVPNFQGRETLLMAAKKTKTSKGPVRYCFWCTNHSASWHEHNSVAQVLFYPSNLAVCVDLNPCFWHSLS